ncbi:hypothetical protein ABPG72_017503 [Tetrahymena utriculariae]
MNQSLQRNTQIQGGQASQMLNKKYIIIQPLAQGSYGCVYQAYDNVEKKFVCIKKIKRLTIHELGGYGIATLNMREYSILNSLNHDNIIKLKDQFYVPNRQQEQKQVEQKEESVTFFMVFDYIDLNLDIYIKDFEKKKCYIPLIQIKSILYQIVLGIYEMHVNGFIHRDIKPANILISKQGQVKIADLGLARQVTSKRQTFTPGWITLWYRPLEMLSNQTNYTKAVDIWSVGCVFGEMVRLMPLFRGQNEPEQAYKIIQSLGYPTEFKDFDCFREKYNPEQSFNYERNFPYLPEDGIDLLQGMLNINPSQRLTAKQCKEHRFFDQIKELSLDQINQMARNQLEQCQKNYLENQKKIEENRLRMQEQEQQRLKLLQQLQQYRQKCESLEASPEYDL